MYILFKKRPLVTLVYVSECFQINLEILISEWAKIKKINTRKFVKKLKLDDNEKIQNR
jgi:hypothetical protein